MPRGGMLICESVSECTLGQLGTCMQPDDNFLKKWYLPNGDQGGMLFKSLHGELSNLRWDVPTDALRFSYRFGSMLILLVLTCNQGHYAYRYLHMRSGVRTSRVDCFKCYLRDSSRKTCESSS